MKRLKRGCSKNMCRMGVVAAGVLLAQGMALGQTAEDKPQTDPAPPGKMNSKNPVKKSVLQVKPTPKPEATQALTLSVTTDKKTYTVGTPITMTLTAKNTTAQPMNLTFTSGQKYDFTLREGAAPNGKIVWQWSKGRMFPMMVSSTKLEAGKSLTFTQTYPSTPTTPATGPLKAGTYTLTAMLTASSERPSATTQVIVR